MKNATYADQFCDWLVEEGYTHCFFVAGGNIMHLLNSARNRFICVPVVHEVAASIAVEYFNETSNGTKAFALVTAGPGLTNSLSGIAGAWLESREMLVVGGQVKSTDLASPGMRQRGIQEIDGLALTSSITKASLQVTRPLPKDEIMETIQSGGLGRPGPIFIEFCLDAQGSPALSQDFPITPTCDASASSANPAIVIRLSDLIANSSRPLFLIGGGINRRAAKELIPQLCELGVPIMTTWNAMDRLDSSNPLYWGRPNTWGQRSANILLQQADLVVAIGTRLGMQQTGFNWKDFVPSGKVVQIDIDPIELEKGHPRIDLAILGDAPTYLRAIIASTPDMARGKWDAWKDFGESIKKKLPNNEGVNSRKTGYLNPYDFVEILSRQMTDRDILIPCSSGGAFTTVMQVFQQKSGQIVVTNKGLASMGYGLAGAIGASYANPTNRVVLVEGDGGFAQNLQEVGTVKAGRLPIKMFIYDNGGYASIRMTQVNYFDGAYVGCDRDTGLGLPDWTKLFIAYGIRSYVLNPADPFDEKVMQAFNDNKPCAFLVPIDPEQTYFPKISSRVLVNGQMESNPLHLMTPSLPDDLDSAIFPFLPK